MAKKIRRRKFLGDSARTGVKWLVGAGILGGTVHATRKLTLRQAKISEERRVKFRAEIDAARLSIDKSKWMPFFEIYNFNVSEPAVKNFVSGVDGHCKKLGISLRRFFETMHYHPILPIAIKQLETPKTKFKEQLAEYEKQAADYKRRKKPVPDKVEKKIYGLTEEIARLGRVQSVINFCLGHKAAANKAKKDGSLNRVQRVKD